MKDDIGTFYYPYPQNTKLKVYVRMKNNDIEFRMRNDNDPKMWNEHSWISREAIEQAKVIYHSKNGFEPDQIYDLQIARTLIKENK